MSRFPPRVIVATLASCAALSACGTGGVTTVTDGGSTGRPAAATQPLATAQSTTSLGQPIRLDIVSLVRSGAVANLTVRLTNNDSDTSGIGAQITTLFGTDRLYHGMADDTMNGVALIDALHGQRYLPAEDAQGNCVCGTNLNSTFVAAGQSVTLSATFGMPPAGVTAVDVSAPHFGTLQEIPIATGKSSSTTATAGLAPQNLDLETDDLIDNAVTISQVGTQVTIRLAADVLFAFNKATLSSRASGVIGQVVGRLRTAHPPALHVDGYTDSIGSQSYNIGLSDRRAAAVASALRQALGASAPQMMVTGHGAASPVAPNRNPAGSDDPAGRALNRRVEVTYAG